MTAKDKFIIYNYTPNKISDVELFSFVLECVKQGKISNNNIEYCYITIFGKEDKNVVSFDKTKSGYRINVYNDTELRKQRMIEKI